VTRHFQGKLVDGNIAPMDRHPRQQFPLRPDYREAAGTVTKAFWRGIAAQVLGEIYKENPARVLKHYWPQDTAADALLTRAAVSPADTTTSGWTAAVGSPLLGPFLSGIAPRSAAARLFQQCVRVELVGRNKANFPRLTTTPAPAFIAEKAPAPVIAGAFDTVDLGPAKKLMLITGITSELARYSADNAEVVIRTRVGEVAGRTLDTYAFDATAGDAVRPAGLLYGVTPTTATTGGGLAACVGDLQNIVDKICAAGGGSNIWIFAAPKQAIAIPALVNTVADFLTIVPAPGPLLVLNLTALLPDFPARRILRPRPKVFCIGRARRRCSLFRERHPLSHRRS
jgi:hypothetical protein